MTSLISIQIFFSSKILLLERDLCFEDITLKWGQEMKCGAEIRANSCLIHLTASFQLTFIAGLNSIIQQKAARDHLLTSLQPLWGRWKGLSVVGQGLRHWNLIQWQNFHWPHQLRRMMKRQPFPLSRILTPLQRKKNSN